MNKPAYQQAYASLKRDPRVREPIKLWMVRQRIEQTEQAAK